MSKIRIELGTSQAPLTTCSEYSDDCIFRVRGICKDDEGIKKCIDPGEKLINELLKRKPNQEVLKRLRKVLA